MARKKNQVKAKSALSIQSVNFPETATTALPVYYRTYSRQKNETRRETKEEGFSRAYDGLLELGNFTKDQQNLIKANISEAKVFPSGRWLWVGGTDFVKVPENYFSAYNCCNILIESLEDLGHNFNLLMQGSGVGAILEQSNIDKLPTILNKIDLTIVGEYGLIEESKRQEHTKGFYDSKNDEHGIIVGDSRQGWVDTYLFLLQAATNSFKGWANYSNEIKVCIDVSYIRPAGTPIKGFGGVTNPSGFIPLLERVVEICNGAVGRKLRPLEVSFLLNEAAKCTVAGNVRRSARIDQFSANDEEAAFAKLNLWTQDEQGNWKVDKSKDALRMANFTRIYHEVPSLEELEEAIELQTQSGEGAIMYAPNALKRTNNDLPNFRTACISSKEKNHRLSRIGLNPCGEILGSNFLCVSGETLLITKSGLDKIKNLTGQSVEIWNGEKWSSVIPYQTGANRKLYRVTFKDGSYIDATENHRWFVADRFSKDSKGYEEVLTKDLMNYSKYVIHTEPFKIDYSEGGIQENPQSAYTLGFAVGDGTYTKGGQCYISVWGEAKNQVKLKGTQYDIEIPEGYGVTAATRVKDLDFKGDLLKKLKNEPDSLNVIASWSREAILHFVAGLADSDGSNTAGNGIRIYISDYERALRVKLLLTKCGIQSSVNFAAQKGEVTNKGVRSKDLCYLQITDCSEIPCQRLDTSKGCLPRCKGKYQIIKSVELLEGDHDTFCFTEPEKGKGVFNATLAGNCNLAEIHLNQLDPHNLEEQKNAFSVGGLIAASLLTHQFPIEKFRYSRELDPIVGVSFTGAFDFFVNLFGADWLLWWAEGRPQIWSSSTYSSSAKMPQSEYFKKTEREYLQFWRSCVEQAVREYCEANGLKVPNRCTTVQPAGTKSLLTGASSGWHPPKAQRYIRRVTFAKNDPVALACMKFGYSVVPSQSDKDEEGNLLNDPFDPRCTEWLVEMPVEVAWADQADKAGINIGQLPVLAQFDFYMQVQTHYVTHNTSGTLEVSPDEIKPLAKALQDSIKDGNFVTVAMLGRSEGNTSFPRLPFEPASKEKYEELMRYVISRREGDDFYRFLEEADFENALGSLEGPAQCDSDKCLF